MQLTPEEIEDQHEQIAIQIGQAEDVQELYNLATEASSHGFVDLAERAIEDARDLEDELHHIARFGSDEQQWRYVGI